MIPPSEYFPSLSLPHLSLPWQIVACVPRGSVWSQEDTVGNSVWELGEEILLPFSCGSGGLPRPLPAFHICLYFLDPVLTGLLFISLLLMTEKMSVFSSYLLNIVFLLPCYSVAFVIHSFFPVILGILVQTTSHSQVISTSIVWAPAWCVCSTVPGVGGTTSAWLREMHSVSGFTNCRWEWSI